MKALDFNCFIGGWPFHKVRNNSFDSIKKLHNKNGIAGGYVSSTDAIFYNDPYEAELELHDKLKNQPSYRHIMTVNPTLPGCIDDIARGVSELNIAGVRILPGFHDYALDSEYVLRLCGALKKYRLPLFLTLRMEDERVSYMFHPKTVPLTEVERFLISQPELLILLCNIRLQEVLRLKEVISSSKRIFFDSSGLKEQLFPVDYLGSENLAGRLVYGSLAPIFCLKSTMLLIEKSNVGVKDEIRSGAGFISAINEYK